MPKGSSDLLWYHPRYSLPYFIGIYLTALNNVPCRGFQSLAALVLRADKKTYYKLLQMPSSIASPMLGIIEPK